MSTISKSQNAENITASTECVEKDSTVNTKVPEFSETEFTRAVVEGLGNSVRITDQDDDTGLDLFCYVHCGPDDDSLISQCRGVVFHQDKIVMRAFPYTVEYDHTDKKSIEDNIQPVFKDCTFYDAQEGALIRMFNFSGRWYTSTHRKLNAFRSKWSSKESFGTSFKRALESEVDNNKKLRDAIPDSSDGLLERFQSILDPAKQYMFLVRHNEENRIVCATPSRPTLYHVGTFVNGELVLSEDIHIPYPKKHTFLNINELSDYVSNVDIRDIQGVIVFAPNNKQYKVLNRDYLDLFSARGNEPSIKFRYLQVRMNNRMVNMLKFLYPEMCNTFEQYENTLYAIAKMIYHSYVQRHVKGKWSTLPKQEYRVDRECHSWHEKDRKKNIVTLEKTVEVLNQQNPTSLNAMIRRFNNWKNHNEEAQETVKSRNRYNTIFSFNNSPGVPPVPPVASSLLLTNNRRYTPTSHLGAVNVPGNGSTK